jgi:hypothetical protein
VATIGEGLHRLEAVPLASTRGGATTTGPTLQAVVGQGGGNWGGSASAGGGGGSWVGGADVGPYLGHSGLSGWRACSLSCCFFVGDERSLPYATSVSVRTPKI